MTGTFVKKMKELFIASTLFVLLAHVAPSRAAAESMAPELVKISTPMYSVRASQFKPPLGSYTYSVSWQGIPAAEARVSIDRIGDAYQVTSEAKTSSGIDIFYELRYKAVGLLSKTNFRPIKTSMSHRENSKIKKTEIRFFRNGTIDTTRVNGKKDPVHTAFKSHNFTLDPFAAVFMARGVDWEEGKTFKFDTFNGKTRYLITMTAHGKDTMEFNGVEREVWLIEPKVENLSDPSANSKLRKATIYLTTDNRREVLAVKSKVFIGNVSAELDSFDPYPIDRRGDNDLMVARNDPLVPDTNF
jgi:hypothetical protein